MNDRAAGLLNHYDCEVLHTRKGRGAILCDTDKGCLIFKEYIGNPEKLKLQNRLLLKVPAEAALAVEAILPTKEDTLFVEDTDGRRYTLKTYFENRECNLRDTEECMEAVRTLAKLHQVMCLGSEDMADFDVQVFSAGKEYEKHNRELRKVWRYLRGKESEVS